MNKTDRTKLFDVFLKYQDENKSDGFWSRKSGNHEAHHADTL